MAPAVVVEPFEVAQPIPAVRGVLHRASGRAADGLVLTHSASGNSGTPLLVALAEAFAADGVTVLRCDLPYRQARPAGPPAPGGAARDRQGLRRAVEALRGLVSGRVFLGGVSYGGRQASMLATEEPDLATALLLLSYPLHPPGKPEDLRIEHLPRLRRPVLFVHGDRDPFGALEELKLARGLVSAPTALLTVKGGHDLGWGQGRRRDATVPGRVVAAFRTLV